MASALMMAQGTKSALSPAEPRLSEAEFLLLAEQLPDWILEYSADGQLTFMPPTDPITSERNATIVHRLKAWAQETGRGVVSGPDGGFKLPDGSRMAPDAAWFERQRWQAAQVPDARFPVFAPEFIIELRSPSDRRQTLEEKMQSWVANGVLLGWLVDPIERTVTIYRPGREAELVQNPAVVAGDGPLEGFLLPLAGIFDETGDNTGL